MSELLWTKASVLPLGLVSLLGKSLCLCRCCCMWLFRDPWAPCCDYASLRSLLGQLPVGRTHYTSPILAPHVFCSPERFTPSTLVMHPSNFQSSSLELKVVRSVFQGITSSLLSGPRGLRMLVFLVLFCLMVCLSNFTFRFNCLSTELTIWVFYGSLCLRFIQLS